MPDRYITMLKVEEIRRNNDEIVKLLTRDEVLLLLIIKIVENLKCSVPCDQYILNNGTRKRCNNSDEIFSIKFCYRVFLSSQVSALRRSTGCIFRQIFFKHTKKNFCAQCVGKGLNCQTKTIFSAKFKIQSHQSKI